MAQETDFRYVASLQADAKVLLGHLAARGDKQLHGIILPVVEADGGPGIQATVEESAPSVLRRWEKLVASMSAVTVPAEEIARSPTQLAVLVQYVDFLSRQALPANARTIQITDLYTENNTTTRNCFGDGENPFTTQVRSLRRVMMVLQTVCILALMSVLALFALAESGRQSMTQLQRGRDEIRSIRVQLEALPDAAWTFGPGGSPIEPLPGVLPGPAPAADEPQAAGGPASPPAAPVAGQTEGVPLAGPAPGQGRPGATTPSAPSANPAAVKAIYRDLCPQRPSDLDVIRLDPRVDGSARILPSNTREGFHAFRLCNQLYEAKLREDLVFIRLFNINCTWFQVASLFTDQACDEAPRLALRDTTLVEPSQQVCDTGHGEAPPPCTGRISNRHWSRTEIRTAGSVYLITALILPLLMGLLGGCTFVFRRLSAKIAESSLDGRDALQSLLRVLMAMLLGGLVGVLSSGGEAVSLAGFSMTLAAVAFFVGFSVEPVFAFVENLVKSALAILEQRPGFAPTRGGGF